MIGAHGVHYLRDGRIDGTDPLASFAPGAPWHLLRTDGFAHVADLNGFVEGIRTVLAAEGVAALEFPYLGDMIERAEKGG